MLCKPCSINVGTHDDAVKQILNKKAKFKASDVKIFQQITGRQDANLSYDWLKDYKATF